MKTRVATRIILTLFIPVFFLLILGSWSWWVSNNTRIGMLDVRHVRLDAAVLALRMQQNVIQIQQWLTDISATQGKDGLDDGYKQAEENYQAFLVSLTEMKHLLSKGSTANDSTLQALRERIDPFYAMGKRMAAAYIDEGTPSGNRLMTSFDKESTALQEVLLPFVEEQKKAVFVYMDLSIDMITFLKIGVLVILSATLTLSVLGGWLIVHSILLQLGGEPLQIGLFLERLAEGNLNVKITKSHAKPIGLMASGVHLQQGLLNTVRAIMIQSDISLAVTQELIAVRENLSVDAANSLALADEVLTDNSVLHNDTNSVNAKALEASHDVETAAKAVKQMEENVRSIAASATHASQNMTAVAASAAVMSNNATLVNQSISMVDGSINVVAAAVEEMTTSLSDIQNRCQQAARESAQVASRVAANQGVMQDLETSIQEIRRMVSIIKNIADKTTLLALNAAIEAAGAGKAGAGFAVVANEVKDLANKTNDATRLIASLIEQTRKNSQRVTESFLRMSDNIGTINQHNQEIAQAVAEQSQTVGEIAHSMERVRTATHNVTKQANEIESSTLEVTQLVQEGAKSTQMIAQEVIEASNHAAKATYCSSGALFKTEEVSGLSANVLFNAAQVQKKTLQMLYLASYANGSAHHTGQLAEVILESSDSLRQSIAHFKIEDSFVELTQLKTAHLAWLGKLENVVWGKEVLRTKDIADHQACVLGQWYNQQKQGPLSQLPIFAQLGETHIRIHALAQEVITMVQQSSDHIQTAKPQESGSFQNYTIETNQETVTQQQQRLRREALIKVKQFNHLRKELFSQMDQLFLSEQTVDIRSQTSH
ncbi:MAG: CZB domain-containing protein [Magnetococcales bacterium]|nr:CZB domain-containing protein [Magnetococcales bacterium]